MTGSRRESSLADWASILYFKQKNPQFSVISRTENSPGLYYSYSQTLINCVLACKAQLATDKHARASTNASHPSTTITTSIEMEEPSQRTIVLRHVRDVAFALVSRWLPCTLSRLPVKQGRRTQPAVCLARSIARSLMSRWQIYYRARYRV